jgi:N-acetylglucosamine-6-sulfatase
VGVGQVKKAVGLAVALGLTASCVSAGAGPVVAPVSTAAAVGQRPNIVVILTDDMRWDELQNMPSVQKLLVAKGVQFTNAFVPNSLCCPSRSTILSGQFSNHTKVWNNSWSPARPFGGFKAFIWHEDQTLATWLHAAGYRTGLVGKYLNGFNAASAKGPGNPTGLAPRPGWDVWDSFVGANAGTEKPAYYGYSLDVQGTMVEHGSAPADYSTNVLGSAALDFVRTTAPTTPFFLYFAPYGPHSPYTPAPNDLDALPPCATGQSPPGCYQPITIGAPGTCPVQTGLPPYCSENIAQKDMSNEVSWVKALPPNAGIAFDATRRLQEQTLLSVDRQVSALVGAVYARHQLHNTLFVFMSDNSLSGGSHRWINKMTAWDEADHIPMVMRFDPVTAGLAGTTDPALVLNADLAPTALAVAGVTPPPAYGFDGQAVPPFNPAFGRDAFPLEHLEAQNANPPTYCGVRTTAWKYVRYQNLPHLGYPAYEQELYDLVADPFELHNLAADPAYEAELATLKARAEQLCDPPPPGFQWGG